MSENPSRRTPADPDQVTVDQPSDVNYWRKKFGCTEPQLRQAIATVGASAAKVRQFLKNKSTPPKGKAQRFQ
jgi:hypothetical protein